MWGRGLQGVTGGPGRDAGGRDGGQTAIGGPVVSAVPAVGAGCCSRQPLARTP